MKARLVAMFVLALWPCSPALAGKPDKGNAHGKHDRGGDDGALVDVDIIFSGGQRDAVRGYYEERYGRGHCPPGLAKKNNGCLPPGQAKKRYGVGRQLPPDVVLLDLPGDLSGRIGKPPKGYRYGVVDGDVVKLALGSLLVVDAIDGLTN